MTLQAFFAMNKRKMVLKKAEGEERAERLKRLKEKEPKKLVLKPKMVLKPRMVVKLKPKKKTKKRIVLKPKTQKKKQKKKDRAEAKTKIVLTEMDKRAIKVLEEVVMEAEMLRFQVMLGK